MASTTALSFSADAVSSLPAARNRRRRISPEAGRALEILGHAIEYLTDEFLSTGGDFVSHPGEIEAVQLLMAQNRKIYFDCPVIPTLRERLVAFLHPQG